MIATGKVFAVRIFFFNEREKIHAITNVISEKKGLSQSLEYFCTVWKIARQSERFLDSLKDFRRVRKMFLKVWKICKQNGRPLNSPEDSPTVWKISRES